MPAFALAPFLAQAGLSVGQSILANQAAKRQQQRMEEEAARAKLINSFGGNAQPTPVAPQQPSMAQQLLADPLTKQLVAGLIGGIGQPQSGGVSGLQNPALLSQPTAPTYSTQIGQFRPRFGG